MKVWDHNTCNDENESLRQQLSAAIAACKLKDAAIKTVRACSMNYETTRSHTTPSLKPSPSSPTTLRSRMNGGSNDRTN